MPSIPFTDLEDITVVSHFEEIQKVRKARVEEKLVEHMSEKAVSAILQQPDTSTDMGKRDAFLMLFLYKTAARVQELVDVRIKDIQIGDSPRVILHGKGNKARVIPLRDDVVKHLEQYLLKFHTFSKYNPVKAHRLLQVPSHSQALLG